MRFALISTALFATANVVIAVPTGHTFMRAACDIAQCVAALAPTAVTCGEAAAKKGLNFVADAECLAAAASNIADFPDDCDQCAQQFHIAEKAKAAGSAIKDAAEEAGEKVVDVAGKVGDAIGNVLD